MQHRICFFFLSLSLGWYFRHTADEHIPSSFLHEAVEGVSVDVFFFFSFSFILLYFDICGRESSSSSSSILSPCSTISCWLSHITPLYVYYMSASPPDGWMDGFFFFFLFFFFFFFKGITGVVWAREHSEETWGFIMCSCLRLTNSETKRLGSFSWLFFFFFFLFPFSALREEKHIPP